MQNLIILPQNLHACACTHKGGSTAESSNIALQKYMIIAVILHAGGFTSNII